MRSALSLLPLLVGASGCLQDVVPSEPALAVSPVTSASGASGTGSVAPAGTAPSPASIAPIATPSAIAMMMTGAAGASASAPIPGAAGAGGAGAPPTAAVDPRCDLRGGWLEQHVERTTALGTTQLVTVWNYHRFEQDGERVRVVQSLDCGIAVRGSTDVSFPDATIEAVATRSLGATGVQGRFAPSADGASCMLELDRSYAIRGADRARYLDAVWKPGDPPKPLSEFALPKGASDGMEDWDSDGHEGITIQTGLGDRYIAQIDYFGLRGQVPAGAQQFGGEGVISVDYDAREAISTETPILLQTTGTAVPPGYAFMARVDGEFELPPSGERLDACRRVQALSVQKFGDPPRP